jgi:DNA-directed RNA polymerase subunit RPC12/RpoP
MTIEFRCSGCDRRYRIADSAVERKMRCKACGAINLIEPSGQADTDPFAHADAFAELQTVSSVQYPPIHRAARKPLSAAPAFLSIPGEDAIDRFVPLAIILLFAIELIGMLWHDVSIVWAALRIYKVPVNDNMSAFGPAVCRPWCWRPWQR